MSRISTNESVPLCWHCTVHSTPVPVLHGLKLRVTSQDQDQLVSVKTEIGLDMWAQVSGIYSTFHQVTSKAGGVFISPIVFMFYWQGYQLDNAVHLPTKMDHHGGCDGGGGADIDGDGGKNEP